MGSKLNMAFDRAKTVIESMYRDKATVSIKQIASKQGAFDDDEKVEKVLLENVPAKVSKRIQYPMKKSIGSDVNYDAVIYLDTSIKVPQGAIIDLTDVNGNTQRYYRASAGYVSYKTHQEVTVTYDERK